MNALGMAFLGLAARGVAFAAVGCVLVLVARHRPAMRASAALATLTGLMLVGFLTMSPWPRWWDVSRFPMPHATNTTEAHKLALADPKESAAGREAVRSSPDTRFADFWAVLRDELAEAPASPVNSVSMPRWRWPAWIAAGAVGISGLALLRLALAVGGVARLRGRCRAIEDVALREEVDLIRAEISCVREVEIVECSELSSPATIGWWKPALLLPKEWREWAAPERAAVLAHELAHVERRDYAAGLWAQLCLSMHWFNPLAHWLMNRLRLEQELAADATAARVVGGRQVYLTALASLALRCEPRPVRGPVRAFLPARDTFVRRIQMLRDVPNLRPGPASRPIRSATMLALGAAALVVAGLRGPASPALAYQVPEAPALGAVAAGPTPTTPATPSDVEVLDLVPFEAGWVVEIRPEPLLAVSEVSNFLKDLTVPGQPGPVEEFEHRTGLKVGDLERVVLVGSTPTGSPVGMQPPFWAVVATKQPADWKHLVSMLLPNPVTTQFAGKTYFKSDLAASMAVYVVSDRVAVVGAESDVRSAIGASRRGGHGHNWDDALSKVEPATIRMAMDSAWLSSIMQPMTNREGALSSFSPLWGKTLSLGASLKETPVLKLDGAIVSADEASGESVADTLRAALTLSRNALQNTAGTPTDVTQPATPQQSLLAMFRGVISPVLSAAKVSQEGAVVRLRAETTMTLADMTKALAPMIVATRNAARRTQSANNLKQIMLALHNYHDTYGKFPPAVIMGPDGKTPHSWRVAILPFLEQESLYRQYKLDEPWDGPNNRKLLEKIPAIYRVSGAGGDPTYTNYFGVTGEHTVFGTPGGAKIASITDGTSNTVMVIEAKRDVPWTKPDDFFVDSNALPKPGGFFPNGFHAGFGDGSTGFLAGTGYEQMLRSLITKDGGEVVVRP